MTSKQMRAIGWRNATTKDASALVIGRRYLVANRKGTKVDAAVCNETLENVPFWDQADSESETVLGEVTSWPWFKEDRE